MSASTNRVTTPPAVLAGRKFFTPEMRELPESLLKQATKTHDGPHRHFHKHAEEGGAIVVDTLEGVLREAGEIISAKIQPRHLVE